MEPNSLRKIKFFFKAFHELGLAQVGLFGLYQFGLFTGHYRRLTPSPKALNPKEGLERTSSTGKEAGSSAFVSTLSSFPLDELFSLYPLSSSDRVGLEAIAGEICHEQVRLFGGLAVPLKLDSFPADAHWTEYESGHIRLPAGMDIKDLWEPARFSWVFPLGRGYFLSGNERYASFFWQLLETFLQANPPYQGVQWMSGQEVALRLMALIFAGKVFENSLHTTPDRIHLLYQTIFQHAARIPPTLVYARSQNNNHLISEAAGLYTAGLFLSRSVPDLAKENDPTRERIGKLAYRWKELGWLWVNRALQAQISVDGTYAQHSTNYHRLMLQLALWIETLSKSPGGYSFPQATQDRLAAAAHWLAERMDPQTGQVPNLGANDGALLMPLTPAPFEDYRPVVRAAMTLWPVREPKTIALIPPPVTLPQGTIPESSPATLFHPQSGAHVFLHTAQFTSRPSHADQLHLDLWWRGLNIARDAGTYRYNAPPPWNNSLASTAVHNTVLVDGQEQMTRVSSFLWLDWAQAWMVANEIGKNGKAISLTAQQNGYRRFGVLHQRSVSFDEIGNVIVKDELIPTQSSSRTGNHAARLHWLLPDWAWSIDSDVLKLASPFGEISLEIQGAQTLCLARAGEALSGSGPIQPTTGWYSPTYGQKEPALAWIATTAGALPIELQSYWKFPVVENP